METRCANCRIPCPNNPRFNPNLINTAAQEAEQTKATGTQDNAVNNADAKYTAPYNTDNRTEAYTPEPREAATPIRTQPEQPEQWQPEKWQPEKWQPEPYRQESGRQEAYRPEPYRPAPCPPPCPPPHPPCHPRPCPPPCPPPCPDKHRDCAKEILCSAAKVANIEAELFEDIIKRLTQELCRVRDLRELHYVLDLINSFLQASAVKEHAIAATLHHTQAEPNGAV